MIDLISYIIGYTKGASDGTTNVVLKGGITCTDDGNGNITITEEV